MKNMLKMSKNSSHLKKYIQIILTTLNKVNPHTRLTSIITLRQRAPSLKRTLFYWLYFFFKVYSVLQGFSCAYINTTEMEGIVMAGGVHKNNSKWTMKKMTEHFFNLKTEKWSPLDSLHHGRAYASKLLVIKVYFYL